VLRAFCERAARENTRRAGSPPSSSSRRARERGGVITQGRAENRTSLMAKPLRRAEPKNTHTSRHLNLCPSRRPATAPPTGEQEQDEMNRSAPVFVGVEHFALDAGVVEGELLPRVVELGDEALRGPHQPGPWSKSSRQPNNAAWTRFGAFPVERTSGFGARKHPGVCTPGLTGACPSSMCASQAFLSCDEKHSSLAMESIPLLRWKTFLSCDGKRAGVVFFWTNHCLWCSVALTG